MIGSLAVKAHATDGHAEDVRSIAGEWQQRAELSGLENQRRAGGVMDAAAFDFADEDDMVALVVAAAVMAFKPGKRLVQDRQAMFAELIVKTGKAVTVQGRSVQALFDLAR
jgi:hypothetical protein